MAQPPKKKERTYTKDSEKGPTVFKKLLTPKPQKEQIYARIPIEKYNRFKGLLDKENVSMYQALEFAVDLLFDYYDRESKKLGIKSK